MEKFALKEKAGINVAALSETLTKTDKSYKFLWLYSLLEVLKQRGYKADSPIAYRDIFYLVLRYAKTPSQKFRLSLGVEDKLSEYIEKIEAGNNPKLLWDFDDKSDSPNPVFDNRAFMQACKNLSAYVPTRWLHPFVEKHTKTVRKRNKTRAQNPITEKIIASAQAEFYGETPPPYRVHNTPSGGEIFIHPKWAEYFAENGDIVRGWCLWHFAQYLQKRNPNVPGVLNKIIADENNTRRLEKQTEFWRKIIKKEGGIPCIYSGKLLTDKFELDHYIPWSFVGHDNLWNLIPAYGAANSSKGDRLPSDQYIDKLVKAHCRSLSVRAENFPNFGGKLVESYYADLRISREDLTNEEKMRQAYKTLIPPLMDLAKANGFKGDWKYNSKTPLYDKPAL